MLEKFPLLISIAFPPKVRLVNMDLFYTFVGFVATLLGEMSWKILGELVDGNRSFHLRSF